MTYDEAIKQTPVVLVEFFASWCPHCRKMMPVVDQVKELLDGSAAVIQLDIDENKELAQQEEVEGIPTFIIYSNGEEQWRHSGEIDGNALLAKIQSYQ
ncbi:MAG: thioredoxin family protein [Candidatus Homeothermus sp.]|jgi:putative thioredoxin|uniref:thioredoxin family protein n=1 Tax=Bacteroides acidifaciens TaxID=85831 RepID=UPI000D7B55D0|nr:thioredoxin family protein [Bacteroides acidifaciens]MBO5295974.1 thioredoxin family protein [Candidatus Homeothermus sp.]PWL58146.1 MAG: thiol reductase thioredoxin [Bacteroidales bacterium]